jgi:hypothetical protein
MRRKPLNSNPNSMHMIMENFRKYQNVLTDQFGEHDNNIYLFEGRNPVPSPISLDEFMNRFTSGKLTESQTIEIWERSWDYEASEVNRLFEQHALMEQDEEEDASPQAKAPMWLRALGKMINKGLQWLTGVMVKGLNLVVSGAKKVYSFIVKFKEKHPLMFKIIVYSIVLAILVGLVYTIYLWFEKLREDPVVKKSGAENAPLCKQAIASTLQEQQGECIANGVILNEARYRQAMGVLQMMKETEGTTPEEIQMYEAAENSLTECYTRAQAGETLNLADIIETMEGANTRAQSTINLVEDLWKEGSAVTGLQTDPDMMHPAAIRAAGTDAPRAFKESDFLADETEQAARRILSDANREGKDAVSKARKIAEDLIEEKASAAAAAEARPLELLADLQKIGKHGGRYIELTDLESATDEEVQTAIDSLLVKAQTGELSQTEVIDILRGINQAKPELGGEELTAQVRFMLNHQGLSPEELEQALAKEASSIQMSRAGPEDALPPRLYKLLQKAGRVD